MKDHHHCRNLHRNPQAKRKEERELQSLAEQRVQATAIRKVNTETRRYIEGLKAIQDTYKKVLVKMVTKHRTSHTIHRKKKPQLLGLQAKFLTEKVILLEVPKLPTVKATKEQLRAFNEKMSQSIQENIDPEPLATDLEE